jgi:hypothetical protein
MDDKQFSQRGMVVGKKGNLMGIKRPNKRKKLRQLVSCGAKF